MFKVCTINQFPLKKLAAIHLQYMNTITIGYIVNSNSTEVHMPLIEKYSMAATHMRTFSEIAIILHL
jgi:hypothetical protein